MPNETLREDQSSEELFQEKAGSKEIGNWNPEIFEANIKHFAGVRLT